MRRDWVAGGGGLHQHKGAAVVEKGSDNGTEVRVPHRDNLAHVLPQLGQPMPR
jgi:hypothetical protein